MALERAVLAGGCFWGMQDLIRKLPGIEATRVGYTGGDVVNATYRNHGTHAEGIEIFFDTDRISYRRILEFFFPRYTTPLPPTGKVMTTVRPIVLLFIMLTNRRKKSRLIPSPI